MKKNYVKSLLTAAATVVLALTASNSNVQAQAGYTGCITEAVTNGALVGSTTASASSITNWSQSSASEYWQVHDNPIGYRAGIMRAFANVTNTTTARLSQTVSNVAVENDSLTIIINGYFVFGSGSSRMVKLSVFWSPVAAALNTATHRVAEVRTNASSANTASGFNNAKVYLSAQPSFNGNYFLKVRIPYTGSGPASGTIHLAPESISGSGITSVDVGNVYMPAHSCSTPPPAQPPFDCGAGYAYLIQDADEGNAWTVEGRTGLYRINLATGATTLIKQYLANPAQTDFVQMNAMAYNPVDNYLWARRFGTDQIVRIGADGSTRFYTIPGLYGQHGSADISAGGIYYLYDQFRRVIDRIDLNTMTLLAPVAVNSTVRNSIIDIAINPLDGMIYAAPMNGSTVYVQRIDPATGVGTDLYNVTAPSPNNGFGALYFDNVGNLYGNNNGSGQIWKFTTVTPYTGTFLSNGSTSASNDGARCPFSAVAATVNIGGKVWNDANGDAITNGSELGLNPGGLYANLVDADGKVVASEPVGADGSYTFLDVEATGVYSVILTSGGQVLGDPLSLSDQLPGSWEHTGTNVSGTPNTGNHTGIISGITTGGNNVSGLDFGINDGATPPCPPGTELAPVIN